MTPRIKTSLYFFLDFLGIWVGIFKFVLFKFLRGLGFFFVSGHLEIIAQFLSCQRFFVQEPPAAGGGHRMHVWKAAHTFLAWNVHWMVVYCKGFNWQGCLIQKGSGTAGMDWERGSETSPLPEATYQFSCQIFIRNCSANCGWSRAFLK